MFCTSCFLGKLNLRVIHAHYLFNIKYKLDATWRIVLNTDLSAPPTADTTVY